MDTAQVYTIPYVKDNESPSTHLSSPKLVHWGQQFTLCKLPVSRRALCFTGCLLRHNFEVFVIIFQISSDSGSKEYKFPGGAIQVAQYWKDANELSSNEKIFNEFLHQVIEEKLFLCCH